MQVCAVCHIPAVENIILTKMSSHSDKRGKVFPANVRSWGEGEYTTGSIPQAAFLENSSSLSKYRSCDQLTFDPVLCHQESSNPRWCGPRHFPPRSGFETAAQAALQLFMTAAIDQIRFQDLS